MNENSQIQIARADHQHKRSVVALLKGAKLPAEDLPALLENFFVAIENKSVIGVVGLEQYGTCGLLRSLVVDNGYREKGIASGLVKEIENHAISLGIDCIYLLTETAPAYFERKGYEKISRDEVPISIRAAPEFAGICPVSAIVMKKTLKHV